MASSQYWAGGKSINAQRAESEGKYSKTVFKKVYGIDPSILVNSCEWHHSSKFFNKVDYYDINDVMTTLAEMNYIDRHIIISKQSKLFKEYWKTHRFNYITYTKPEPISKLKPVRDLRIYSFHNSEFQPTTNLTDKQLFKAIYKILADRKYKELSKKIDIYKNIGLKLDGTVFLLYKNGGYGTTEQKYTALK